MSYLDKTVKFYKIKIFYTLLSKKSKLQVNLLKIYSNKIARESEFVVMDVKSPTLGIADVRLPGREPYGFHGIFVPESDLKNCKLSPN